MGVGGCGSVLRFVYSGTIAKKPILQHVSHLGVSNGEALGCSCIGVVIAFLELRLVTVCRAETTRSAFIAASIARRSLSWTSLVIGVFDSGKPIMAMSLCKTYEEQI